MSPVPWATAEPGLVETVVAVLLSRENPRAQRVRPSQGDGGLDVIVPADVAGTWDDYQVKYFFSNLTDGQKGQIEKSLRRAAATHADPESGISIGRWLLTLPLDPTREQLAWLSRLAAELDVPFECEWRGRAFLDGLAARYPDVIDYYFRDGRERLEQNIVRLRALAGLGESADPGMLVTPDDAAPPLAEMFRALNHDDPHFLYEFEVGAQPPAPSPRPRLVASVTRGSGSEYVTFHVIARYDEATSDRPVPLSFQLDPAAMPAEAKAAWDDAMKFGTPVRLDGAAVPEATVDLPGGLGWSGPLSNLWMGPSARADAGPLTPIRLTILPADGEDPLAQVVVVPMERTQGPMGGVRLVGSDRSGLLSFEVRMERPPGGSLNITQSLAPWPVLGGRPVQEVVPVLRFASAWHAPNRLAISVEHAPLPAAPHPELSGPAQVPAWVLAHAESLAIVSDRTRTPVGMPDVQTVTEEVHRHVAAVARLLLGHDVEVVADGLTVTLPVEAAAGEQAGPDRARSLTQPLAVVIDGTDVHVCDVDLQLPSCRLVSASCAGTGSAGQDLVVLLVKAAADAVGVLRRAGG